MYYQVAKKLAVLSTAKEHSQAVNMEGANGVELEFVLYVKGGGDLEVRLQGSNDLENWSNIDSAVGLRGTGFNDTPSETTFEGIAHQFVRLEYEQTESGTAIIAASINTADR